jgi:hypothetical protein
MQPAGSAGKYAAKLTYVLARARNIEHVVVGRRLISSADNHVRSSVGLWIKGFRLTFKRQEASHQEAFSLLMRENSPRKQHLNVAFDIAVDD